MSWFQSSGFAHLAKNALSSAQKTIDRALDIHVENNNEPPPRLSTPSTKDETESFFAAFGIGGESSRNSGKKISSVEDLKVGGQSRSLWGSFSGSFFETPSQDENNLTKEKEEINSQVNLTAKDQETATIEVNSGNLNMTEQPEVNSTVLQCSKDHSDGNDVTDNLLDVPLNNESFEEGLSVIIQQPSSGKVKLKNAMPEVASNKCLQPLEMSIQLTNDENINSSKKETNQEHVKLGTKSGLETLTKKSADQVFEKGECNEGCLLKNKEVSTSLVESNVVEVLEKSTDSSETIKDEGENETLVIENYRENTNDDSQSLPEIWEWENKRMTSSEDNEGSSVTSVPISDLVHYENSPESSDVQSDESTKDTVVHLRIENLEGSFVNVISNVGKRNSTGEEDDSKTGDPSYLETSCEQNKDETKESSEKDVEASKETQGDAVSHSLPENQRTREMASENKITDSLISASSTSNSFVTCMIEEAMVDQDVQRSHSPHSTTSSSEKSDMVKMESEQNSGHTSGDEVETTTSSDIEILSMSSPNGDNSERLSLSPIKQIWIGKPNHGPHLRRTDRADSPSSDTSSVRDSPMSHRPRSDKKFVPILVPSASKDGKNYPSKFQGSKRKTVNVCQYENQNEIDILGQKLAEMTEILKARENKLVELSRENMSLHDKNDSITKQLQQVEQAHAADARDVTTLTEEFSQRLATMERNLQNALKEKENLKQELKEAKEELVNKICAKEVESMIKEKDTQIQELLQEGEKLSKQQLQHLNIIKKLRTKEKENENHIKQQKEKLEEQSNELERSRKALSAKEEIERKQIDAIRHLTNTVQKQEKEISNLKNDLEDAQEKVKSLKSVLDTSYKELAELHRSNIEKESQVQEVVISAEITAKEEVRLALEKAHNSSLQEREALMTQIEDLRITLTRTEQQANRREDVLRLEIADLQQRLQEADIRNQELMQNTSAASRPLLRQIENLQATFSSQSSSWEKIEKNLTDRLNEAQMQLSIVTEKERSSTERYMELNSRLSSLEAQNNLLRQEKTRFQAELETKNVKLEMLDEWKTKESVQTEMLKQSYANEITELKRETKILEHQLDIEKTVVEAEKRKNLLLLDQIKEKEKKNSQIINQSSNRTTPSPTSSLSKFSSVSDSFNLWIQDENLDQNIMTSSSHGNRFNLYDTLRHNTATSFLEGLQSQLKMKEGEIVQLQNEILQLEKVRESMAQELVRLSSQNEDIEEELKHFHEQQSKFQDMEQKYNALLQMYGEKVEEADELRLDLQDVKEMYKAQINDLLKKK